MDSAGSDASLGRLKSGDLVLFAEQGLARGLIRWFSRGPWSHVGLVLRGDGGEPLLWEAAGAGPRRVTRATPLAERVAGSRGPICVRCLDKPLAAAQCTRLEALRQELAGRDRTPGLLDLIGAAEEGWLGGRRATLGNPMDGELVAQAYQHVGLLDDVGRGGRAPGDYRPWHFCERYGLELKGGYALGPELVLREPDHVVGWSGITPQPA